MYEKYSYIPTKYTILFNAIPIGQVKVHKKEHLHKFYSMAVSGFTQENLYFTNLNF